MKNAAIKRQFARSKIQMSQLRISHALINVTVCVKKHSILHVIKVLWYELICVERTR